MIPRPGPVYDPKLRFNHRHRHRHRHHRRHRYQRRRYQAMLKTLDPYTEFEEAKAAQDVRESVSGKYGGVGLVIATDRQTAESKIGNADSPSSSADKSPSSPLAPPVDGTGGGGGGSVGSEGSGSGGAEEGAAAVGEGQGGSTRGGKGDLLKKKLRKKKAPSRGVLVVSAFEDYAFDRGMRVGDRIIKVDGVNVASKTVEEVRDMLRGKKRHHTRP